VVLAIAVAAPAHAVVLIGSDGSTPQPYQQWADQAHVPTVPGAVWLVGSPCPTKPDASCTGPDEPVVWLFRSKLYLNTLEFREALLHELGHRFDYQMPQWVRDRFRAIMRNRHSWRATSGGAPVEQFAEAYAICGLGGKMARTYMQPDPDHGGRRVGDFGYAPTDRQNKAVCKLIRGRSRRCGPGAGRTASRTSWWPAPLTPRRTGRSSHRPAR
jgi:hypothetical protein